MKTLLALTSVIFSVHSFAQETSKEKLTGKWVVVTVTFLDDFIPAEREDIRDEFKKAFTNAEFDFQASGKFYIKYPSALPPMMEELFRGINDTTWEIDPGTALISIGTDLMGIYVRVKEGKTYFLIEETGILLEVVKK